MSDCDITICGSLGRDPELRFSSGGASITTFSVAVSRRWQRDGEWQEKTSWIDVTCFGALAENTAASLQKGARVVVKGRIEMDEWEDRDSGQKRTKLKMVADDIGASLRFATAQVERIERSKADDEAPRSRSKAKAKTSGYGDDYGEPF